MKNIDKNTLVKDLEVIHNMLGKYSDAIWENQEGQKAHYDNQLKGVKIVMEDVRCGLFIAREALQSLNRMNDMIIYDEEV